jgi:hypothetical protein
LGSADLEAELRRSLEETSREMFCAIAAHLIDTNKST